MKKGTHHSHCPSFERFRAAALYSPGMSWGLSSSMLTVSRRSVLLAESRRSARSGQEEPDDLQRGRMTYIAPCHSGRESHR